MSALRMRLVEKAEGIIRESVKPLERIDGIKILHVRRTRRQQQRQRRGRDPQVRRKARISPTAW
jgi:hypothetical protein